MGTNSIDNEDEELFVTITLEDDSEIECEVLTIFEVEEQDYIALLHDNGEEDGEIFIYRYFEDEDGEPGLDNIETQEEFESVKASDPKVKAYYDAINAKANEKKNETTTGTSNNKNETTASHTSNNATTKASVTTQAPTTKVNSTTKPQTTASKNNKNK